MVTLQMGSLVRRYATIAFIGAATGALIAALLTNEGGSPVLILAKVVGLGILASLAASTGTFFGVKRARRRLLNIRTCMNGPL